MEGSGTLTWEDFVNDAQQFERESNEIMDHWKFLGDMLPSEAYLMRQEKILVSYDYPIDDIPLEKEEKYDCYPEEEWNKFDASLDLYTKLLA